MFVDEDWDPCCFLDLCLCLLQWWCFRCFFLCFLVTLPDPDADFSEEEDDFFAVAAAFGDGMEEAVELGETRRLSFLGVYVWWSWMEGWRRSARLKWSREPPLSTLSLDILRRRRVAMGSGSYTEK